MKKVRSLPLTLDEAYILVAAIHNNLIAIDETVCPEWADDLKRMQKKVQNIANEIKYGSR